MGSYNELMQKNPESFAAKNNLAEVLALRGERLDDAMKLVAEAIQSAGPIPPLRDTRATIHYARGELDRALADMQVVVKEAPSAIRYFHLAKVYDAMGRGQDARDALQEAIARGLDEQRVHPLEKAECRRLLSAMK